MVTTIKYKIIKSLSQYNEYCNKHEALLLEDEEANLDEIELLELLIEDYDQRKMKEKGDVLNPVELLRSLMGDSNISQSELAKSLDVSRQLINDFLNYRRNISKGMVLKLAKYFSMTQEAFSRRYELESNREELNNDEGSSSSRI